MLDRQDLGIGDELDTRDMAPISLDIVVLDCDTPVPNVYAARGTYADIFEVLLRDAAVTTSGVPEKLELEFSGYDCVRGGLPSVDGLDRVDGIVITGSGMYLSLKSEIKLIDTFKAASAYDDAPWIKSLFFFIQGTTPFHLFYS